jgi:phosphonate transport system substrate-binding protein
MLPRLPSYLLILCLLLLPVACSPEEDQPNPTLLKVGVLPDDDALSLGSRYAPLLAHLSEELDAELQLVIPEDYSGLLELFGTGEIDIGYFGGVTFAYARTRHGAEPVVMRDIDAKFTTYFLAGPGMSARTVEGFEGRAFAFGSSLSTSGHLMPRYFLKEMGITPERFFGAVRYSGAHDRTAAWVRDGVVDLGAANAEIVEAMFGDGRLAPGAVEIVWETPPYADYVWAVRPGLGETFRTRLRDAFLKLSPAEVRHAEILRRMGAGGFLPTSVDEFDRLEKIIKDFSQFQIDGS